MPRFSLSSRGTSFFGIILIIISLSSAFFNSRLQAQEVRITPALDRGSAASFMLYAGEEAGSPWAVKLENGAFESLEPDIQLNNVLDYDISPDGRHLAVLRETDEQDSGYVAEFFNQQGIKVGYYSDFAELDAFDPSLKLYLLQNAGLVLRDNIVSFTLYTYSKGFVERLSNASGSSEGESMSRLASSRDGSAVYVYNPRIMKEGGGYDSRIMQMDLSGELKQVFYQQDAEITHLFASNNGEHVFAVFVDTQDRTSVQKIDAGGNVVAEHRPEELDTPDAYVQPELNAITWFEDNQARTYNIETGERLALAYLRGENIVFATYSPEDEAVITLTGRRNNSDGEIIMSSVRVVDLDARSILSSDDTSHQLEFQNQDDPRLSRIGARHFRLTGVSNAIDIRF
jgi:hypothetical protein